MGEKRQNSQTALKPPISHNHTAPDCAAYPLFGGKIHEYEVRFVTRKPWRARSTEAPPSVHKHAVFLLDEGSTRRASTLRNVIYTSAGNIEVLAATFRHCWATYLVRTWYTFSSGRPAHHQAATSTSIGGSSVQVLQFPVVDWVDSIEIIEQIDVFDLLPMLRGHGMSVGGVRG